MSCWPKEQEQKKKGDLINFKNIAIMLEISGVFNE